MKKKFKRFGKSSLSFVLSLLLIVSTLIVENIGSIDASADALVVSASNPIVLYYNMSSPSWWQSGCDHWAYFFHSDSSQNVTPVWEQAQQVSGSIYSINVPNGMYNRVIFCRVLSGRDMKTNPSWDKSVVHNQTGDITLKTDYNYITSISEGGTGTFNSTYKVSTTASFSASATSVVEESEVTFTTTLASTTYNDLKSVDLKVTDTNDTEVASSVASVSDNKVTFNTAGTYRVYNEVTYNAKGFTNITDTTDMLCL